MRIVVIPSWYSLPGHPNNGIFFRDQVLALRHHGIDAHLFYVEPRSLHEWSLPALRENHFQVVSCTETGIPTFRMKGWNPLLATLAGGLIWSAMTVALVDHYIRTHGIPDLIHAHSIYWGGYAAMKISRKHQVPFLVTEHASPFYTLLGARHRRYLKQVVREASAVVAVSRGLAAAMEANGVPAGLPVIPNVVDTDFFIPSSPKKQKRIGHTFITVANLNANKGIDLLLRAFAESCGSIQTATLIIVGDGPERESLRLLAASLGLANRVTFTGSLDRQQVRHALQQADTFVLASRKETFGVVLIEALSTGLPVIASRSGGPEDIVTQEVGHLFDPDDQHTLATLLQQACERQDFNAANARELAINRYAPAVIAADYTRLYASIIRP